MPLGVGNSLRRIQEPRTTNEETEAMPATDSSTQQLRQRLVVVEAAQVAAVAEISRLAAANEELTIAKYAMLADIQVYMFS